MVKHQWLLQFCGKYFYGELQTTIEWMNVGYPTLACLWVHHNVSTLRSRANKMPNACMPPKALRRRRRKGSSRSNNRRDLNPKPKLKKGVRFWKQKRERERERLSNRKKSNNISKRKAKRVKLHPKKKMLGAKSFNFPFHKMEYIDVCAINRSINHKTSFCFFISFETRGLLWISLPSILARSLPCFHVLLLFLLQASSSHQCKPWFLRIYERTKWSVAENTRKQQIPFFQEPHTLLESWIGTRFFLFQIRVAWQINLFGLAYQGKDIVFRFIIEYSSLRDFYRPLGNK